MPPIKIYKILSNSICNFYKKPQPLPKIPKKRFSKKTTLGNPTQKIAYCGFVAENTDFDQSFAVNAKIVGVDMAEYLKNYLGGLGVRRFGVNGEEMVGDWEGGLGRDWEEEGETDGDSEGSEDEKKGKKAGK
jgi:hypothetical protein